MKPVCPYCNKPAPEGLTTDEAAETANVLPQTLEEAYAEGRKDQYEQDIGTINDLVAALRGMMSGSVYKSVAGGECDWHIITMPSRGALEKARLAIIEASIR